MGFPHGSVGKEFTCNAGDLGSIPGLGRSPGKGKGYPLQYSSLENSMGCIVHGVAKSWTQQLSLSSFQKLQIGKNTHTYVYIVLSNRIFQDDGSVLSVFTQLW